MPPDRTRTANPSAFGRLAKGISWEGPDGVRRFRDGGVGRADVLQGEVLYALDMLPRRAFLGALLERAHGAEDARARAAAEIEQALVDLSVEEVFLNPAGVSRAQLGVVQPDALLESPGTVTVIELRPVRPRAIPQTQLAKLCACALLTAEERSPLLLVVLAAPPPIPVTGQGGLDLVEAVTLGLGGALAAAGAPEELVDRVPDAVAWISWPEVVDVVRRGVEAYSAADPSTEGAVRRLATSLTDAVDLHGAVG